ncbi:Oidioi.mRNA.OKI2018_I69.YSR.g17082.t1.cds [Oikopleura dioica]|uniref:Oidioi.mRNA.OKI2018_I69.YSR.g17082.t1.cds n=1 Tax=Oikopleura dioica TaxID=34765 RepID=A0ABN7SI37_OIKDI|nr:Oidioi.mRNA.OKI2018_I69.YSR.g17082.t1.cds [Oikopleura dioica]
MIMVMNVMQTLYELAMIESQSPDGIFLDFTPTEFFLRPRGSSKAHKTGYQQRRWKTHMCVDCESEPKHHMDNDERCKANHASADIGIAKEVLNLASADAGIAEEVLNLASAYAGT